MLLDFHGVAAGSAPAVTNVKNDDIERVRVATNSREPLITRVVIDLARKIPYTVEQVGEELRVLFKPRRCRDCRGASRRPPRRAATASKSRVAAAPVAEAAAPPLRRLRAAVAVAPAHRLPPRTVHRAADALPRRRRDAVAPALTISQAPLPVPMPASLGAAQAQPR